MPPRRFAAGAAYSRAQGSGRRIRAVHGLDQAQQDVGELVVEVKLPSAGAAPSGSYEGDGYVIVRHPNTDVVRAALANIVRNIRVELE